MAFRKISRESYRNDHTSWVLTLPSLALLVLLALPIVSLLSRAWNANFIVDALSTPALSALRLSLVTSALSVLATVLAGTPLAYLLARRAFKGKTWLELTIDLPVVLPPSVAGLALLLAFGRQGIFGAALVRFGITIPFTTTAVVMAQTFVSAPLYIRAARIGFTGIDSEVEEAARVAGANQWQLFRDIMFPLAARALLSGGVLAWTRALGEFGATILFAGNLQGVTQTMPLAIYLGFERNVGVAIALSVVLVVSSILLLLLMRWLDGLERPKA